MNEIELNIWIRMCCWAFLLLALTFVISEKFTAYQHQKGEAISLYMLNQLDIDIPPEQARFLNVNVNQWDVEFSDINIFPK